MKILYDGWSLAFEPNSAGAIHLITLLENIPRQVQPILALPASTVLRIPENVEILHETPTPRERDRLKWEHVRMPSLAKNRRANLVHLAGGGPALWGAATVLSPTDYSLRSWEQSEDLRRERRGFKDRLREAMAAGGMTRLRGILWPSDLPAPAGHTGVIPLHPALPEAFSTVYRDVQVDLDGNNIPETYILYLGPQRDYDLRFLLDAWSWAAGSIGENYPLLIPGMDISAQVRLADMLKGYELAQTVHPLPPVSMETLALLCQRCSALFHPAELSPWGDPIRLALACDKPVVALDDPATGSLVGPAAYLAGSHASRETERKRLLGAALVTVIVEESVAESLAQAAAVRAAPWRGAAEQFSQDLWEAYQAIAG